MITIATLNYFKDMPITSRLSVCVNNDNKIHNNDFWKPFERPFLIYARQEPDGQRFAISC